MYDYDSEYVVIYNSETLARCCCCCSEWVTHANPILFFAQKKKNIFYSLILWSLFAQQTAKRCSRFDIQFELVYRAYCDFALLLLWQFDSNHVFLCDIAIRVDCPIETSGCEWFHRRHISNFYFGSSSVVAVDRHIIFGFPVMGNDFFPIRGGSPE